MEGLEFKSNPCCYEKLTRDKLDIKNNVDALTKLHMNCLEERSLEDDDESVAVVDTVADSKEGLETASKEVVIVVVVVVAVSGC